jgi:signal transduction histidine kinase
VCTTVFDNHRHLQGITLSVPDWNAVRTWDVGADDPFVLAVRPLDQLLEFHAGGEGLHREHVRGTVLLGRADGSFYLQDATGGILIQAQAATGLINVGRTLDVVGFPSIVNKWPVLQEAMVRGGDKKSDLTPAFLPPESLLNQARHGTLVRLQARVIGRVTDAKEELLELQAGPWIAEAMLEKDQAVEKLGGIEAGSTVELTGVYQARLDDNLNIQSFQILLRSPADVRVLARPNWWTARRVIWSVATLGMAFALVLGWVTLLRTQVNARTRELRVEIEERKRMEAQVARTHKELLEVSRSAGMAEVASNVLHNVGNVLNSVNVSASLVVDRTRQSKVTELGKVAALLDQHAADLPGFLAADPTGAELRGYLHQLNQHLAREQQTAIAELMSLHKNIEHIKDIVARQQSYAKISGVTETIAAAELVEDALRMNAGATRQGTIQVVREYADVPPIMVEKHKVLQILVNLIRNAEHACNDSGRPDQQLRLRISPTAKGVAIAVTDNGVGVPAENLTRIFGHGFTTRKGGHGFGLHGGALAARELGGSLTARSDGPGTGATFVLELALAPKPG